MCVCPPTFAGFLEYVQTSIRDEVIDSRLAMRQAWESMAASVMEATGVEFEGTKTNPSVFGGILKEIESHRRMPRRLIESIKGLEIAAHNVINMSRSAYDPSPEEAQRFIASCAFVQAELKPSESTHAVRNRYIISDETFCRFNQRTISFRDILIGQTILSGIGKLQIQRNGNRGRADIVIDEWFGTYGTTRLIHLGEKPFGKIVDHGKKLFLDGVLCR